MDTTDTSKVGAVLACAYKYLNVKEATGHDDGAPATLFNDGEAKAWCAAFARTVFHEAGCDIPGNHWMLASVKYMAEQMQKAGRYFEPAQTPHKGDLIFFLWVNGPDKGGHHVGIVADVVQGSVHTIEGNSGDRVAERQYPLNYASIAGYGIGARWSDDAASSSTRSGEGVASSAGGAQGKEDAPASPLPDRVG